MIKLLSYFNGIIKKSFFLAKVYNVFIRIYAYTTPEKIKKRSMMSIFNYQELSKPLKYYPFYENKENNLYGNGHVLLNKFNIDRKEASNYHIEHGLILGSLVQNGIVKSFSNKIITFSNYRLEYIKAKTKKEVITVGPYIQYAGDLLSKTNFNKIKMELGTVLLVFPSHSTAQITAEFDFDDFLQSIDKYKTGFDNVLICLYWKDVLLGRDKLYIKKGYKVVTAGHYYDYNFITRLKLIIKLADYTISNAVGTHVGYCISLGKPHFIIASKVKQKSISLINSDSNQRREKESESLDIAEEEILKVFTKKTDYITLEQINCVKKYWGSNLSNNLN